jgi:hypothetical protein
MLILSAAIHKQKNMDVKVISLKGCNAAVETIDLVKMTAKKLGLSIEPESIVVNTTKEAIEHRHIGGPTVQVNGLDIEPAARSIEQFYIS